MLDESFYFVVNGVNPFVDNDLEIVTAPIFNDGVYPTEYDILRQPLSSFTLSSSTILVDHNHFQFQSIYIKAFN
jgi:hypothetical protein